ncbi:hypothetical protein BCR39DRAFT_517567 [Naematelia encephala]|uniref:Uncharacterized protein n=1 Tax=Naematelia encephala TaxID=71784 RepID=A0A1Y2BID5_9TREE|nr:hypothetical protein BCR39DRAFT_517567 [Naematelia encephala]
MRSIRFAETIPLTSGILCFTLAWAGYTLVEIHGRNASVEVMLISTWVESTINTVLMVSWIMIRKDTMLAMQELKVPTAFPIAYIMTAATISLLEAQLVTAIASHVKTYGFHSLFSSSFWRDTTGCWSERAALGADTMVPGANEAVVEKKQ